MRWIAALRRLCLGALLSALAGVTPAAAQIVTMKADLWCPYNCEPDSDRPGFAVDIARAVFGPAGYTVEYSVLPWARTLDSVRAGETTIAIGATAGDVADRGLIVGKEPIGLQRNALAMRKDAAFAYSGPDSLRDRRLGAILGYSYDDAIDAHIAAHKGTDAVQLIGGDDALQQNIRKLLAGRVDAVVDSVDVLRYAVVRAGQTERVSLVEIGEPSAIYLAFSRANPDAPELIRKLDEGIAAMRRDGRLAAILGRYGAMDWAVGF